MAGSGDIRAGGAFVEIFVKGNVTKELDKVAAKLKAMGDSLKQFGQKTALIGTAIVGSLLAAAKGFSSYGADIDDASKRTGVAADKLQELKYAAEQSGASFEDLESGLRKMQKLLFEAATGSSEAAASLKAIGLSAAELQGLTPEEQLTKIADGFARISDPTAAAATAMSIFGKGGAQLIPLLSEGGEAIRAMGKEARDFGIIMGNEDVAAAAKFDDTLATLFAQVRALTNQIGAAVVNALQPFADAFTKSLATIIKFTKENRNLVIGVLLVGAAMAAAGVAIIGLGIAAAAIGTAMAGLAGLFGAVAAAVGFLLNPIVLVSAALIGLVGYFVATSETGAEAAAFLASKFSELAQTAKETFGGIADALASGDIALAANILWTGLKVAWKTGTAELSEAWANFRAGFVQVAGAAFYGALEIYTNVKASLLTAFENTVSVLGGIWDAFVGTFTNAWNTAVATVTKGLNYVKGAFDDSFDVGAANAQADEYVAQKEAERQKLEYSKAQAREDERARAISDINNQQNAALKNIEDRERALHEGAGAQAKEDIEASKRELADLQKQLTELRGKAKTNRTEGDGRDARLDALKKRMKELSGLDLDDVAGAKKNIDVKAAGTTNAYAAAFMGAGTVDVQQDIKKNTEESARALKQMQREGGLKFR